MTLISAHRCETWAAVDAAVALDLEYVELDVWRGEDGSFVVAHDEIAPLGDGGLPYEAVLAQLAAGGKKVHLDLKLASPGGGHEIEAVRRAVEVLGGAGVVVTTLHDASVRAVRDWADAAGLDLLVGLSLGRGWDDRGLVAFVRTLWSELFPDRRVSASGANLVVAHRRLARLTLARFARRRALPLLVWTVDRRAGLRYWLAGDRAWLVTTNRPAAAIAVRRSISDRRG